MTWALSTAARTLFQECRGEPLEGQKAVAHCLVNRLKDGRWGKSLGEVCLWTKQFSGWRSSDPNFGPSCQLPDESPVLVSLSELVQAAMDGEADPSQGAVFYYATSIPAPIWSEHMRVTARIGHHIFLTDKAA